MTHRTHKRKYKKKCNPETQGNLKNLIMAIDGTVVMTPELLKDLNSVFDARVPGRWTHDPSGAEISW
jgi:hypothetical protein